MRLVHTALVGSIALCQLVSPRGGDSGPVPGVVPAPYERLEVRGALPAEVPLALAGGYVLVDGVRVNGQGPFRFLLDTGAMGAGRVDASLVRRLGLETTGGIEAGDGSGRRGPTLDTHVLDSLEVGPLRFEGVHVLSRDYNAHGADAHGGVDGILGFHLFRELLLTLDAPGRRLRFEHGALPEADGRGVLALDPGSPVPTIEVELAGAPHSAHLDTGSMAFVTIGAALAESLPFVAAPVVVGEARTVSGPFPIEEATLDGALRLGASTFERPRLTIAGPMPGVNLGGPFLRAFALTFDQANGRVRFERASESPGHDAPERTRVRGAVRVPLRLLAGRPVVDVGLGGGDPVPFLIDTGAGAVVLCESLVRELDLPSEGTTHVGDPAAPQGLEARTYALPELQVGEARFEGVHALSFGGDELEAMLGGARGILGLALFEELLVTLDFPAGELVLERGALRPDDGSVAYRLDDGVPTLDLVVAGERFDAHLDTGNPGELSLPARVEPRLGLDARAPVVGEARTPSGSFELRRAVLTEPVLLGGREFAVDAALLQDRFEQANVGSGLLARYAVTFDAANRRLRFAEP